MKLHILQLELQPKRDTIKRSLHLCLLVNLSISLCSKYIKNFDLKEDTERNVKYIIKVQVPSIKVPGT